MADPALHTRTAFSLPVAQAKTWPPPGLNARESAEQPRAGRVYREQALVGTSHHLTTPSAVPVAITNASTGSNAMALTAALWLSWPIQWVGRADLAVRGVCTGEGLRARGLQPGLCVDLLRGLWLVWAERATLTGDSALPARWHVSLGG